MEIAERNPRSRRAGEEGRENALSADDVDVARALLDTLQRAWHEVSPTDRVRNHAGRLLCRHPLRSADALHLAAALVRV